MREHGWAVHVVMTKEAQELIKPIVFQSLSGNRVYAEGMSDALDTWDIAHISLAQKADLILIAPATANIIAKLAAGICDDLLSCTVCASKAKVLIAPAMNENDELLVADFDLELIDEVRSVWQFYRDRRPETYKRITEF